MSLSPYEVYHSPVPLCSLIMSLSPSVVCHVPVPLCSLIMSLSPYVVYHVPVPLAMTTQYHASCKKLRYSSKELDFRMLNAQMPTCMHTLKIPIAYLQTNQLAPPIPTISQFRCWEFTLGRLQ